MTFCTLKRRVLLSRFDLEIDGTALVSRRRSMARRAVRDGHLLRRGFERVHLRYVMTRVAREFGVAHPFVAKRGRGIPLPPGGQHYLVSDLHSLRGCRVKIRWPFRRLELVARVAVLR